MAQEVMRCDRCSKDHKRCSRDFPVCGRCRILGLECTRDRKLIRVPRFRYDKVADLKVVNLKLKNQEQKFRFVESSVTNTSSISNSNYSLSHKPKPGTRLKPNSIINYNTGRDEHEQEVSSPTSTRVYHTSDWNEIIKIWSHRSQGRFLLNHFSKLANIMFWEKGCERHYLVATLANFKPFQLVPRVTLRISSPSQAISNMHQQALKYYFSYFNPSFPLFSKHNFYKKRRSLWVHKIVFLIGLQLMPRSVLRDELIESLDLQIFKATVPSLLPSSLDTLQGLIAICIGLHCSRLDERRSALYSLAIVLFTQLGINEEPLNHNIMNSHQIERRFVLHVITFLDYQSFNLKGNCYIPKFGRGMEIIDCISTSVYKTQLYNFKSTKSFPKIEYTYEVVDQMLIISSFCAFVNNCRVINLFTALHNLILYPSNPASLSIEIDQTLPLIVNQYSWGLKQINKLAQLEEFNPLDYHLVNSMRLILTSRCQFDKLQLFNYASHIKDNQVYPHPLSSSASVLTKALNVAVNLIHLIHQLNPHPMILKPRMLALASQLICRNYPSDPNHSAIPILQEALKKSQSSFNNSLNLRAKVYYNRTTNLLVQAAAKWSNINLPSSSS